MRNLNIIIILGIISIALVGCTSYFDKFDYSPKSITGKYCGDITTIQVNANYIGNYDALCWFWTSYDNEKKLVTDNCITQKGEIKPIVPIKLRPNAQGTYLELIFSECHFYTKGTCSHGLSFTSIFKDKMYLPTNITVSCNYCGDNLVTHKEVCDGANNNGNTCPSLGFDGGILRCGNDCTSFDTSGCYRCGDGKINSGEQCDLGSSNGVVCSPSYGSSCPYCDSSCNTQIVKGGFCGDRIPQSQENCLNCPDDASCKDTEQCSNSGKCINVVNDDNNCGSINHICDITPKTSSTGDNSCSSDYSKAIQVQQITKEQCKYKTCEKVVTNKNVETDCLLKGTYCQEGNCGCSKDYEICEPLRKCVKKKESQLNQPCKCDFQCEEGFCDETSNQCVKGLNVQISSQNSALSVGEQTTVSLSVSNPLNKDVDADITLSLGDGVEIVDILSGDQCLGSQCKLDKTTIPAGGKKDVTVKVKANTATTASMNAFVNYQLGSKNLPIELKEKTSIRIIECGNGKLEEGEISEICCLDAGCPSDNQLYSFTCNRKTKSCDKSLHSYYIYGGVGALFLIFLIIFGISKAVKHLKNPSRKKDKKKEEMKEDKEKEEVEEEKHEVSGSIAKEVEHLHSLMEKGILTKGEFNKKKKKLLKD